MKRDRLEHEYEPENQRNTNPCKMWLTSIRAACPSLLVGMTGILCPSECVWPLFGLIPDTLSILTSHTSNWMNEGVNERMNEWVNEWIVSGKLRGILIIAIFPRHSFIKVLKPPFSLLFIYIYGRDEAEALKSAQHQTYMHANSK